MRGGCKRSWEVDALRDGRLSGADAEAFARHAAACADCRAQQELDARVQRAAAALPTRGADPLHSRRIRQQILATAARAPAPRAGWRMWTAAAVGVASVALAAYAFVPSHAPAPATFGAEVEAATGARWSKDRAGLTETVRLDDGALTLRVRHRETGERFLVMLPDGEIEVRGTWFHVVVSGGLTREVSVREGVVALRRQGEPEQLLEAGARWPQEAKDAGVPKPADVPVTDLPSAAPGPHARQDSSKNQPSSVSTVSAYEAAIALLDADRFDDAARAFHAFVAEHPRAGEAEDAAFLEATALARANHGDAAGVAAERFLAKHPRSIHARDAAVLAVRAAVSRDDCARAKELSAKWLAAAPSNLGACAD